MIPWVPVLAIQLFVNIVFIMTCYFAFHLKEGTVDKMSNFARGFWGFLAVGIMGGWAISTAELQNWLISAGLTSNEGCIYVLINIILAGGIGIHFMIQWMRSLPRDKPTAQPKNPFLEREGQLLDKPDSNKPSI
jgi:hypothetical protein